MTYSDFLIQNFFTFGAWAFVATILLMPVVVARHRIIKAGKNIVWAISHPVDFLGLVADGIISFCKGMLTLVQFCLWLVLIFSVLGLVFYGFSSLHLTGFQLFCAFMLLAIYNK